MPVTSDLPGQAVRCADPDCGGTAEPEQDGDHRYHECTTCGYAFGWQKVLADPAAGDTCAIGVPEDVRRAASAPMENALAAQPAPTPLLTIGRRRD